MTIPSNSRAVRRQRVVASPQYRDGAFRNPSGVGPGLQPGTTLPVMRDFMFRRGERRPDRPLPTHDPAPILSTPPASALRVTWLGHSILVIELDGVRLLTDPVWRPRASPVAFAGPRHFQPIPVAIDALGRIDAVILTHDHFDHLDRDAVVALHRRGVPFIASLGVGDHLEDWGVAPAAITELDWWESTQVAGGEGAPITVTAAPAQHFSGRGLADRNQTLWSSFAIRGADRAFYLGGDTGLMDEHAEIGQRLGPFDVVALEVGAFHPAWGGIHLGPDNAIIAHERVGSSALLPIHWGLFDLALHDWHEPIERLVAHYGVGSQRLLTPGIGETFEPSMAPAFSAWWRSSMRNPPAG